MSHHCGYVFYAGSKNAEEVHCGICIGVEKKSIVAHGVKFFCISVPRHPIPNVEWVLHVSGECMTCPRPMEVSKCPKHKQGAEEVHKITNSQDYPCWNDNEPAPIDAIFVENEVDCPVNNRKGATDCKGELLNHKI